MVVVDRVDLVELDERLDVDRPRLLGVDRAQLLVGDHHVCRRTRVPISSYGTSLSSFEHTRRISIGVWSLESSWWKCRSRSRTALNELHRHVDEPEPERAGPERARHQPRLASSAAIRSSVSSRSGLRASRSPRPCALRSISFEHGLAVGVVVLLGSNFARQRLDELARHLDLALGRVLLRARQVQLLGVDQLVVEAHRSCARTVRRTGARRRAARARGRRSGRSRPCPDFSSALRTSSYASSPSSPGRGSTACRRRPGRSRPRATNSSMSTTFARAPGGRLDLVLVSTTNPPSESS